MPRQWLHAGRDVHAVTVDLVTAVHDVTKVAPESNAAQSGLLSDDVMLAYNGQKLTGAEQLGPAIRAAAADGTTRGKGGIPVSVWRDGKVLSLSVAPGRLGVYTSKQRAAEAIRTRRQLDNALARTRGESFGPLPGTRREVQAIARLFASPTAGSEGDSAFRIPHSEILLGSEASEQRLAELAESGRLKTFRYLHFATHGVLDDRRAMNSALILSQDNLPDPYEQALAGMEPFDGRLTADQIVRTWKLDADLVTLSACETALGKQAGGEGFLGFSQALFVAGARSIALSLWKVDDTATTLLMTRFYENLLGRYDESRGSPSREFAAGTPMPKGEALREAKRWLRGVTWKELRQEKRLSKKQLEHFAASRGLGEIVTAPRGSRADDAPFSHPYYWAAFILIGDPS